ncbi:MAG: hypothetical protein WAS56_05905 [Saprospiraceae bacterium]|nr:hypothetical protein [Saprospiraceae bacterium]MBK7465665.1 hypothetical protein [Saprospiraceae bacterium]MBK9993911.1 hypothetical protein [Saprospiraceae bacterium]
MKAFRSYFIFFLLFWGILGLATMSCKRKYGCPSEDSQGKIGKDGFPKSKTKSGIWDKKKRMNHSR